MLSKYKSLLICCFCIPGFLWADSVTIFPETQYSIDLRGVNGGGTNVNLGGHTSYLQAENFSVFDISDLGQVDSATLSFWAVDTATSFSEIGNPINVQISYFTGGSVDVGNYGMGTFLTSVIVPVGGAGPTSRILVDVSPAFINVQNQIQDFITLRVHDPINVIRGYEDQLGFRDPEVDVTVVPEPASIALFTGLVVLGFVACHRRAKWQVEQDDGINSVTSRRDSTP